MQRMVDQLSDPELMNGDKGFLKYAVTSMKKGSDGKSRPSLALHEARQRAFVAASRRADARAARAQLAEVIFDLVTQTCRGDVITGATHRVFAAPRPLLPARPAPPPAAPTLAARRTTYAKLRAAEPSLRISEGVVSELFALCGITLAAAAGKRGSAQPDSIADLMLTMPGEELVLSAAMCVPRGLRLGAPLALTAPPARSQGGQDRPVRQPGPRHAGRGVRQLRRGGARSRRVRQARKPHDEQAGGEHHLADVRLCG